MKPDCEECFELHCSERGDGVPVNPASGAQSCLCSVSSDEVGIAVHVDPWRHLSHLIVVAAPLAFCWQKDTSDL